MTEIASIDCDEVLRHLFAYLDGEVQGERLEQIRVHLDRCRSCFSRAQFETLLREHLRAIGRADVPAALERRLRSVLDALPER